MVWILNSNHEILISGCYQSRKCVAYNSTIKAAEFFKEWMKICWLTYIYTTHCKRSHVVFVWFMKAHFKRDHTQTVKRVSTKLNVTALMTTWQPWWQRDSPDDNVTALMTTWQPWWQRDSPDDNVTALMTTWQPWWQRWCACLSANTRVDE